MVRPSSQPSRGPDRDLGVRGDRPGRGRGEAPDDVPEALAPAFRPPAEFRGDFGAYRSPLVFDDGRPVRDAADWRERRQEILATWHGIMGAWPPLIERPKVEVLGTERREGFTQRRVRVEVAPDRTTGRLPARARRHGAVPGRAGRLLRAGDRPSARASRSCATSPTSWPGGASSPCRSGSTPARSPRQGRDRAPAAVVPRLRRGQLLQRAGEPARGRPEASRRDRPLLRRQVGAVRLLPLRQVRLRRLVRPRHRLRRGAANVNYWEPWYLGWSPAGRASGASSRRRTRAPGPTRSWSRRATTCTSCTR